MRSCIHGRHVFNGFLDQLARDVETQLTRRKAQSLPTSNYEATLDNLRKHRSELGLRGRDSVSGDAVASVQISQAEVTALQSRVSGLAEGKIRTILQLVVEDPEVQKTVRAALELRQKEGLGDGDALEQLLAGASDKWVGNTPIGSADREHARRTQARKNVAYSVGGDGQSDSEPRPALKHSVSMIKSRPSIQDPSKPRA